MPCPRVDLPYVRTAAEDTGLFLFYTLSTCSLVQETLSENESDKLYGGVNQLSRLET